MKLFLRCLLALVALFLSGTGPLHAYSHRQSNSPASFLKTDFGTPAQLGTVQTLRQLCFRAAPSPQEEAIVRISAPGDNDQDEDEDSDSSGKAVAPFPAAALYFSPSRTALRLSSFGSFPQARSLAASSARRFLRLRVIRI